jgi:hypothetical protein
MCILMDPETRPCGGHGTCSPANICVCDAGWSSIGDLSFDPANECSLFTPAIQAEWVLFFVVMSFAVAGSMWSLAKRFRAGKLTQESMHHWIIFFMAIFEGCMFLPLAVMKILDPPHYAVGLHVGVTVLYCFGGAAAVRRSTQPRPNMRCCGCAVDHALLRGPLDHEDGQHADPPEAPRQ